MTQITIKQYDTRNAINATLIRDGQTVDLTDCTVHFFMEDAYKNVDVETIAEVVDAPSGTVLYAFEQSSVAIPGRYNAEFRVTYPDGRLETFPNNGYITVNIIKSLGGITT